MKEFFNFFKLNNEKKKKKISRSRFYFYAVGKTFHFCMKILIFYTEKREREVEKVRNMNENGNE